MRSIHKCRPASMPALLGSFARCEGGATSIEYALICSLIFMAIVAGVQGVANNTNNMYNLIKSKT